MAAPANQDTLDRVAEILQLRVTALARQPLLRPLVAALSGEKWLGHPAHPAIVTAPAGAWAVTAWFDSRAAFRPNARDDAVADMALKFGIITAVPAALTGIAQFLGTDGVARRTATVHWALNATSLTLYAVSSALRGRGKRRAGRRTGAAAFALAGAGAFLGGELVYKHGVGQVS